MAHFEKYTKGGAYQILHHDEHDERAGKHIDRERTHLNYNLQPRSDPWQFVKDKIDMSKKSGARFNSRSIALVSCIITLPKDYQGDPRKFFEECKKYLDSVFGADNCASAWVHFDEVQGHMHYKATPVIKDGDRLQFNAKKLVSRSFLQRFHKDLDKYLTTALGHSTGVRNGATSHGNQTVEQMKRLEEVKQELAEVKQELAEVKQELDKLLTEHDETVEEYNQLLDDIDRLEGEKDRTEARVARLRDIAHQLEKHIKEMQKIATTLEGEDFAPIFDNRDRVGER